MSQPNIVLIHADQYRNDCFSLRGHPVVETPNLDALLFSGADFQRAYSECPICIPARHTTLTGMDPHTTGVMGFDMRARIARPQATVAALLARAGYQTAHVGRGWHQYPKHAHYGFEIYDADPFAEHYSRFQELSVPGSNRADQPNWPHHATHAIAPNSVRSRPWPYAEEFHETNYAINKGLEFLNRRDKERPFLLSLGTVAPHPPFIPPAPYLEYYQGLEMDEPIIGDWAERPANHGLGLPPDGAKQLFEGRRLQNAKAGYYGLITHLDDQLGLFLDKLRHKVNNVYIFFISDHGEMLGDHYLFRKAQAYEAAANIPFSLAGPGIVPGTVLKQVVGLQDILPTCCEIAGVAVPEHVTGKSVLGLAKGQDLDWRPWLHGEHAPMRGEHPGFHYLTDGKQKYIWFLDNREQLFDLKKDPREQTNLQSNPAYAETLRMWRNRLIKRLIGRPEGFSDGSRLTPGVLYKNSNSIAVVDA
ncbi:MAG: sulfatase-like hydrolase/transferase [Trueperaceae bacterium]